MGKSQLWDNILNSGTVLHSANLRTYSIRLWHDKAFFLLWFIQQAKRINLWLWFHTVTKGSDQAGRKSRLSALFWDELSRLSAWWNSMNTQYWLWSHQLVSGSHFSFLSHPESCMSQYQWHCACCCLAWLSSSYSPALLMSPMWEWSLPTSPTTWTNELSISTSQ